MHFYNDVLDGLTSRIRKLMGVRLPERSIWTGIKAVYASLMARSPAWEIAETFFNSLTRRVFSTAGVDQAIEFCRYRFRRAAAERPCQYRENLSQPKPARTAAFGVDGCF